MLLVAYLKHIYNSYNRNIINIDAVCAPSYIDVLTDDCLAYILIDRAVGEYNITVLYEWPYYSVTEWQYMSNLRLVCKRWRKIIDKYFVRYISIKSISHNCIGNNIASRYVTTPLTTISIVGQRFDFRIRDFKHDIVSYRDFIYGTCTFYINYRMIPKKSKRSGRLRRKATVIVSFHHRPFDIEFGKRRIIKYKWDGGNKRTDGDMMAWQKKIAQKLGNIITSFPFKA